MDSTRIIGMELNLLHETIRAVIREEFDRQQYRSSHKSSFEILKVNSPFWPKVQQ